MNEAGLSQARPEYLAAARPCDIVMKGGVTSGIVYPKAVCRLARTFRFKNIGGTSAGAIAAAATAAAEFGRRRGLTDGFHELEGLPDILGGPGSTDDKSKLFSLFEPDPSTKALFDTFTAGLGAGRKIRIILAALRRFWWAAGFVVLPVVIVAVMLAMRLLSTDNVVLGIIAPVTMAALSVLAALVVVAWIFWRRFKRRIPANLYGLCTGMASETSLTPWLADLLDRLAGKQSNEGPLTFGDLEGSNEDERIRLQMMTTNLSHGRPHRLPFDDPEENLFYFDPTTFRRLFPERIVKWMEDHPRNDDPQPNGLIPLPLRQNTPVVLATRMSLSFPFLISAVPLYARHFGRGGKITWQKCWFSDGGISSNFPVHFFDSPLPRWPTFAINLRPPAPDRPDSEVEMAINNSQGLDELWEDIEGRPIPNQVLSFAGAIVHTMQNWIDNTQLRVPGYRDRIAHVILREGEGGLNLNMPASTLEQLSRRGDNAGAMFVERFGPGYNHPLDWDNHRWIRYRSTMEMLEDMLRSIERSLSAPIPPDRPYPDLVARTPEQRPGSYRWDSDSQRAFAQRATQDLIALVTAWKATNDRFAKGAPRPTPELRVRPRI